MIHQPSETSLTGANRRRIRPTIGFFNLLISDDWALLPWQGIVDAARERDVNLVTYVGRAVGWDSIQAQANVLYDLAKNSRLDGLIIWKAGLIVCLSETEAEKFCKQYNIPVVTLEGRVSGLTCVSYDNYQGMRSAVEHLIDVHGYRRIGFLGMYEHHTGFQERYRGYVDAMTAHGLPIDLRLVRPWFPIYEITSATIDERVLTAYLEEASSLGMEAVIGIADSIALQVQRTLQERGARVPGDVAVVGFDDSAESRVLTPPLTTVKPSWYESGHLAAETLIALLAGESVPEVINVPTVLMVRQSCGCQDPCVAAVTAESSPAPATSSEPAPSCPEIAPATIHAALVNETEGIRREMESLFNTLIAELTGEKTGGFLNALSDALQRSTATVDEPSRWYNVVSVLRQKVLPRQNRNGAETREAENLLQQAQVLIGRVAERTQMLRNLRAAEKELDFQRVSVSLLTTLDLNTLMDTLANELPGLGIPSCYLSFFENPQPYQYPNPAPEWARLILAYGPHGRTQLESPGLRFPARQLIPDELWPQDRACSFVLLSLHFQEEQMGFVLFETGSRKGRLYETLRTQISSALHGALLVQRVQERSTELARQQYILDAFMENVPDSIYFKDLASRFTRINKALALHFELSDPAEGVGKSDFDFFPEEQARPKFEQEQDIIHTGQPILNMEEPDGIGRWALTTKMPLRDERGEIIGTFGISRDITVLKEMQTTLERAYAEVEQQVQERTAQLRHDITERKKAEEALRESEERLRQIASSLREVIWLRDVQTRQVLYVNPAFEELTGQTCESFYENPDIVIEAIHPDDKEWVIKALDQRFEGVLFDTEHRIICLNGSVRWVSSRIFPVRNEAGEVYRWASIMDDITERKRAEEALNRERDLVERIMQTSPAGIVMVDREGQITFANARAEQVLGLTRDAISARTYNDPRWRITDYNGNPFPDEALPFRRVMVTGQPVFDVRHAIEWPDEQRVLLSVNGAPLFNAAGQVDGMVATVEDVTARVQAGEALRQSEATLRSIFRAAPIGIGLVVDRVFQWTNDTLHQMLGYTAEELKGQNARMVYPSQEEYERIGREKYAEIAERGTGAIETCFQRKDGRVIDVLLRSTPLDPGDLSRGVTFTALDITERKRAEVQLERNLRETRVRFEVSQALTGAEAEDEVLDVLIRHAGLYPQAFVVIFTFERRGGELTAIVRRQNPFESGLMAQVPIGEGLPASRYTLFGRLSLGQPFVSEDVSADERVESAGREIVRQTGAVSIAMFPLTAGNEWMGLILAMAKPAGYFDEEKQHLYQALAEQGAVALRAACLRETIRESQQRFQALVETISDWIWELDQNGIFTYVSPRVSDLLGYEPVELLGKTPFDFMPPEEARRVRGVFDQLFGNRQPAVNVENTLLHKDGRLVVFETSVAPFFDPGGEFKGYRGVDRDITERKQAEEALKESEEKFRTLAEQSPNMIFINQRGRVVYANTRCEEIMGYTREEFYSEDFDFVAITAPEYVDLVRAKFAQHMRGEDDALYEYALVTKDGKRIETIIATRLIDYEGKRAILGIVTDITERKHAEAERERLLAQVREQAQTVQEIMDTVPEGVLLLDADNRAILANPLGKKDLVTLADAQVGDTLTHLGDRPLAELLTSPPKGLWHEVAADGRFFQVIARPIEDGPAPRGWVLVIRDMTQQREAERRAQQQERLAAVGQLAAGIAHDFNNIMAVITLYAGMLARTPDLPARVYERLETIHQQAHRASDLIQQILDFSRRAVLERGPMDLVVFLKEQVKMLERTLPESIKVQLVYGKDEYVVNGDPTRLQQAIMNLAANARDAMPEGGRLRIDLERLRVEDAKQAPLPDMPAGEWVRVAVTDTGVGIPPDTLPHIFEPFFTTKAMGEGTGLGLAQVYGIVRQHEGYIDVKTEMGEGTTFTLYLPALAVSWPGSSSFGIEPHPQGHGETILVVEDDAAARRALVDSLEMVGYRALQATNGQEALALYEQHAGEIGLVLSDVVMPEMGGRALLHALKERDLAVRVVLLTGHPLDEKEFDDLRAMGLRAWMLKPLSVEQLAQVVARALEE